MSIDEMDAVLAVLNPVKKGAHNADTMVFHGPKNGPKTYVVSKAQRDRARAAKAAQARKGLA